MIRVIKNHSPWGLEKEMNFFVQKEIINELEEIWKRKIEPLEILYSLYKETYYIHTYSKEKATIFDIIIKNYKESMKKEVIIQTKKISNYSERQEKNNEIVDFYEGFIEKLEKLLKERGFLSKEEILERVKEDKNLMKKFMRAELIPELMEIGPCENLKNTVRDSNFEEVLINLEKGYELFSLDLTEDLSLKKAYGKNNNTILDMLLKNRETDKYTYFNYKGYENVEKKIKINSNNDKEKKILNRYVFGRKAYTKYDIVLEEANNGKLILGKKIINDLLKEKNMKKLKEEEDEKTIMELCYLILTLLKTDNREVFLEAVEEINKKITVGIFNFKFRFKKNFLETFFGKSKKHININNRNLINGKLRNQNLDIVLNMTKEIDNNVLLNLLKNSKLKENFLENLKSKKIIEIDLLNYAIPRLKDYFTNEILEEIKFENYGKDELNRTIYGILSTQRLEEQEQIEILYLRVIDKLKYKELIKFLKYKDGLGKEFLHYVFMNKHEKIKTKLYKILREKEIETLMTSLDYFNKLPYEYGEEKIQEELKYKTKELKRGKYELLYSPSLLDLILSSLEKNLKEIGVEVKMRLQNHKDLNIYNKLESRIKKYGKINDKKLTFKRFLEYTDNIDTSLERSIKKNIKTTLGRDSYKWINTISRLGYSIVKFENKSNIIIDTFRKLSKTQRVEILKKIREIIILTVEPLFSKSFYIKDMKLTLIDFDLENKNREEIKNNRFCVKETFEQILDNKIILRKEELDLLNKFTELFYGEEIFSLYKELKNILKNIKEAPKEKIIWEILEELSLEINHINKRVKFDVGKMVEEKYLYFLQGKKYEVIYS